MKKTIGLGAWLLTFLFLANCANAIPVTLIDQGDSWQYSVLTQDLWVNWNTVGYGSVDWSKLVFQTGDAAFGNTISSSYPLPYNTYWRENTDLALQKTFNIAGSLSTPLTLKVASDNGFIIAINGHEIAKKNAEGYTSYWEYTLDLATSSFIAPGDNLIQILTEDHGGITFFDMKLTADVSTVPEPATMLLVGSGLIGMAVFRRKFKK